MALNKAYAQYQANSISNSSPEELTLMLYNGLLRFILQAYKAIEEKDLEKTHQNIVRAQDIIVEFQATLDRQYEISQNLMLLYDYMYRRLVDANLKKDSKILMEVYDLGKILRDTWDQAMKQVREHPQPQQTLNK